MKLYDFKSIYPLVEELYGVEADENSFEDLGLAGWELINSKHTRLYKYVGSTVNCELELPCNVDMIESVHIPMDDAQMTSNKTVFNSVETLFIEGYIEAWKYMDDPHNSRGRMVKYKEGDNSLIFSRDYNDVKVIYHGVIVDDEDGLPLVNQKEQRAIACFIAYTTLFKEGVRKRNGDIINLANTIKADWLRLCNAARVSEHLSQNDMNSILDAKTRWDRKRYGISFAPML